MAHAKTPIILAITSALMLSTGNAYSAEDSATALEAVLESGADK